MSSNQSAPAHSPLHRTVDGRRVVFGDRVASRLWDRVEISGSEWARGFEVCKDGSELLWKATSKALTPQHEHLKEIYKSRNVFEDAHGTIRVVS